MKTYKFEVKIPDQKSVTEFAKNLLAEIDNDKDQLELTESINRETEKVHLKILSKVVRDVNRALAPLGFKFGQLEPSIFPKNNGYDMYVSKLDLPKTQRRITIKLFGKSDRNFPDSKYTTFTGEHTIEYNQLGLERWSENSNFWGLQPDDIVNDLLTKIKSNLKAELN